MGKPKVIVIAGPTASGKTSLSIELAKKVNGEIVSCDSMQIYKDMNIGTAKPNVEETQGIKHYLIDIINPDERFSVSEFKNRAIDAIEEILAKGKVPIVVGGTGLYLDSLIYGIEFQQMKFDEKYRDELEKKASTIGGLEGLYYEASIIDPDAIKIISPNDKKRIIRILEIYNATGKNKTEQNIESTKNGVPYDYIVFALNWEREKLYARINKRVDIMIEQGLVEEVEEIRMKYNKFPTAMQGLGYKEVVEYLENELTKEDMIDKIKMQTRRYAKRQITWFKKNKTTIWLDAENGNDKNLVEILNRLD